jgi:hypothetical protein
MLKSGANVGRSRCVEAQLNGGHCPGGVGSAVIWSDYEAKCCLIDHRRDAARSAVPARVICLSEPGCQKTALAVMRFPVISDGVYHAVTIVLLFRVSLFNASNQGTPMNSVISSSDHCRHGLPANGSLACACSCAFGCACAFGCCCCCCACSAGVGGGRFGVKRATPSMKGPATDKAKFQVGHLNVLRFPEHGSS